MVQTIGSIDFRYNFIPIELGFIYPILFFISIIETFIAQPFRALLKSFDGFWSSGSLGPFPDGPLLPGSFVVAITYSVILYVLLSLISAWWQKKRN